MSRLDLLKKGTASNNKGMKPKKSPRSSALEDKAPEPQDTTLEDDILSDDDFENELDDTPVTKYDLNDDESEEDSDENVNVIEIDLDTSKGLEIDPSLLDEEDSTTNEDPSQELEALEEDDEDEDEDEDSDIVEGHLSIDYSENDIKFELEYIFEKREQLYDTHVKTIQGGGIEIGTPKPLQLHDIVRVSITLTELKEQVGCEARVVSVFPPSIRSATDQSTKYHYIVQFIGPNAPETERIVSKYLLGYKVK